MESAGRIVSISRSFPGRKTLVTVELDDIAPEAVEGLVGKALNIALKIFRKKRTLTQNGYYWKLIGKVSDKSGLSAARLHNELLREHPHPVIDERTMTTWCWWLEDTEENWLKTLEDEKNHLYPTSEIDGTGKRRYMLLRGSSDYNTEEMGALLDALIERAKAAGVETITPNELARMRALEEGHGRVAKH